MRRRLKAVALLVMAAAGPVDAQISSEGTVRGVVRDTEGEYCQASPSPR